MRVVVVGKGGVGKSTLSAIMARQLAQRWARVVAVDADEQRNLAATLGMALAEVVAIVPVAEHADYVEEKTGARPGRVPAGCSAESRHLRSGRPPVGRGTRRRAPGRDGRRARGGWWVSLS